MTQQELTNKEAIERLRCMRLFMQINDKDSTSKFLDEDYVANDMAVAALEKQIPKKPVQGEPYNWIDSVRVGRRYRNVKKTSYSHACPSCGDTVVQLRGGYCSKCGQAIDWSE